jgi:hypothetical protein
MQTRKKEPRLAKKKKDRTLALELERSTIGYMHDRAVYTVHILVSALKGSTNSQAYPTAMETAIAIRRASIPVHRKRREIPVIHGAEE